MLGLVAGPVLRISGIAVMFGIAQQGGPLRGIRTVPEFLWELSLGIYPLPECRAMSPGRSNQAGAGGRVSVMPLGDGRHGTAVPKSPTLTLPFLPVTVRVGVLCGPTRQVMSKEHDAPGASETLLQPLLQCHPHGQGDDGNG